jgi:hypothetical protein
VVERGEKEHVPGKVSQTDFSSGWTNRTFPRSGFSDIFPLFMPRQPKIHRPPPKLYCPILGCNKGLRSKSGFTQHVQARHRDLTDLQLLTEPRVLPYIELDDSDRSSSPPLDGLDILDDPRLNDLHDAGDSGFTVDSPETSGPPLASSFRTSPSLDDDVESPQRGSTEYHPLINGRP